jgi:hypothetical protein
VVLAGAERAGLRVSRTFRLAGAIRPRMPHTVPRMPHTVPRMPHTVPRAASRGCDRAPRRFTALPQPWAAGTAGAPLIVSADGCMLPCFLPVVRIAADISSAGSRVMSNMSKQCTDGACGVSGISLWLDAPGPLAAIMLAGWAGR